MGRKRSAGNERLGQYVQRRGSGLFELRFPIPADVQHAFRDKDNRPRTAIIRSLATADINLANAKADALKTKLRDDIRRVREVGSSDTLGDFLRWLHDYDLASFKHEQQYDGDRRRRERFSSPPGRTTLQSWESVNRNAQGAALTSEDAEERRAAAGWAADEFFERQGRRPDRSSPEYSEVLEECARVLVDGVLAKEALAKGFPAPEPLSHTLSKALSKSLELANALSDQGRLPLAEYFNTVYAPIETRQSGPPKGERNIPGKRHSVRLFTELVGSRPICTIAKGHLYEFLDLLSEFPDSRPLSGPVKKLPASSILSMVRAGEIKLGPMSSKTANKHVNNVTSILQFAERRRHVESVDTRGVKARVEEGDDGTGRSFTTAELNRLFALPLFSGCAGEQVEGGLFKFGPVLIRDDRFWIPLVLLFTGARSSEVVGLLTSEVVIDHDVPHFLIQPNHVRPRLKNRHSRRMVPVHSRLVEFGFLDFVRKRIEAKDERLFPMAEQTSYRDGATGAAVARSLSASLIMRQFNRTILEHAQARADGGSIKCFRNTFEQESTSKIASDEVRQRLTGRKVISTARIYTDNIPRDEAQRAAQLISLKSDIECISYSAVSLDHLAVRNTLT
ncbi:MAG: hypothetical protein Q8N10_17145 [Phenylobacterium sp.]|uniref:DUF6538 domain-containing protein n=1 Tax=Phenylobacterium sp. TaxID=1871053 RepID=UPI002728A55F|nr:DUF6538 domain-containing protein [Phenylobacterium sp.]MDO8911801.1 hypothetical protein [Phenylobacterium sp.]MDP3102215.1 hypothetical protein [Phenylobacterium sp.]